MTRGVELGGRDVRKAKAGGHGIFSVRGDSRVLVPVGWM